MYIRRLGSAVGVTFDSAEIERIVNEEYEVASIVPTGRECRIASRFSEVQGTKLTSIQPGLWNDFFAGLNLDQDRANFILGADSLRAVAQHAMAVDGNTFNLYVRWRIVNEYGPFVNARAMKELATFQLAIGDKEKTSLDEAVRRIVFRVYPREAQFEPFLPEEMATVQRIEDEVLAVAREYADNMPAPIRTRVISKLSALRVLNPWQLQPVATERCQIVPGDRVHCILALRRNLASRCLAACGSLQKTTADFDDISVRNAWYNPWRNDVVIGAGYLHGESRIDKESVGTLYGRLATAIGHEITHSIDGLGIYFGADGHFAPLPEGGSGYIDHRTADILAMLAGYRHHVHRRIDRMDGEMLADLGGMELGYAVFERAAARQFGNDAQRIAQERTRFFAAFADAHISFDSGENRGVQQEYSEATNQHPCAEVRINVSVRWSASERGLTGS